MTLFNGYLMVDWSAAGTPRTGRDSIWLALHQNGETRLENPATRVAARHRIADILKAASETGDRILAGFDFPFGYPAAFSRAIGAEADWRDVWARILDEIEDGDDNSNNRFDAAARLNALFPGDGPFWGNGLARDIDGLPRKKPEGWGNTLPTNLRYADASASGAQEVWKLSGNGSVGSQALTGIARLEALRRETGAKVWPFETFGEGRAHVFAEIFPSLVPMTFPEGQVRDATQVSTVARAFARLDRDGMLDEVLSSAAGLPEDVRRHEATILGLNQKAALAAAVASEASSPGPSARAAPLHPLHPLRYERDPAAIYAQSFETVRREARLDRFAPGMAQLATRVVHACGMIEVADRLAFSPGAFEAGAAALAGGAPVFADCEMVAAGVIRRRLPAGNAVIVTLNDPTVPGRAAAIGNTRSAAAVELWADRLDGAVVAVGNAPTALFHLLELIDAGAPKPALILGFPVGFVGAAESKAELARYPRGCDFVTLRGRRGGSAMASAAVNALAAGLQEIST